MRTTLLLILLLTTVSGSAGVVSRDLFEPGDGLLTYDDVNQREWLDFSVTAGMTEANVLEHLSPSGELSGFSYAQRDEVRKLANAFNATFEVLTNRSDLDLVYVDLTRLLYPFAKADPLVMAFDTPIEHDLLGNEVRLAVGRTRFDGTADGIGRREVAILASRQGSANSGLAFLELDGNVSFGISATSTYWLYRDAAPVPEPTTACLALTAWLAASRLRGFA